jgi:hypothetical protein
MRLVNGDVYTADRDNPTRVLPDSYLNARMKRVQVTDNYVYIVKSLFRVYREWGFNYGMDYEVVIVG